MQQVEFRQAGRAGNPEAKLPFLRLSEQNRARAVFMLFSWTSGTRLEIINQLSKMKHL
jgi:hypothetical protein